MRTINRGFIAVGFVTAALAVSGCSGQEPGSALPQPSSASASGTESTDSSPSSGDPAALSSEALDPCTLLKASDLARWGEFEPPRTRAELGVRTCEYPPVRADDDAELRPTLTVGVRDEQTVDTVNDEGYGINRGNLNGRRIAQIPAPGGCIISIEFDAKSRVDVGVTGIDTNEACNMVGPVAELVEPRLPEG